MKKLSMFILAAFVGSTAVLAQDSTTTTTNSTKSTTQQTHKMSHNNMGSMHKMGGMKMKDCVMMKDGKMMVMKGGEKMSMDSETTLTDGSTISTEGLLTKQDGTTKQLKNGDGVYMDGKMVSKMKKHGMHKKSAMKVKTETTTSTSTTPQ